MIFLWESSTGSARFDSRDSLCAAAVSCSLVEMVHKRSWSWGRSGRGWVSGSCAAANAQEHREERREVKIDGSSGPTHSPAQADVSQSKYDCASLFCATLPNRARLFLFHRYPLKSAYFGCPGVEQGEVKLVLSAVLQTWPCSSPSSFCRVARPWCTKSRVCPCA